MTKRKRKIEINIPILPPKEASPNFRGHWAQVYRAKAGFKVMVKLSIPVEVRGNPPRLEKSKLSVLFTIPDKRHYRDVDNALSCLKPAIDACVDAGILVNDAPCNLSFKGMDWVIDKDKAPLTTLIFEEQK